MNQHNLFEELTILTQLLARNKNYHTRGVSEMGARYLIVAEQAECNAQLVEVTNVEATQVRFQRIALLNGCNIRKRQVAQLREVLEKQTMVRAKDATLTPNTVSTCARSLSLSRSLARSPPSVARGGSAFCHSEPCVNVSAFTMAGPKDPFSPHSHPSHVAHNGTTITARAPPREPHHADQAALVCVAFAV